MFALPSLALAALRWLAGSLFGPLLARAPRWLWLAFAALIVVAIGWRWHERQLRDARLAAATAQHDRDARAVTAAAATAARLQHATVVQTAAAQAHVNKDTDDALTARLADLGARYDALRLRWAAARADPGRTGADRTAALPNAAGQPEDAACAAAGWVAFDTAAAAAHAADAAIAKDDAWIAWAAAQAAAWPKE